MKAIILLMFLGVFAVPCLANDTLRISTPVENIGVEINEDGNTVYYVKVANAVYETDKSSYLVFKDCLKKNIEVYPWAIIDDKNNRIIKIISK